MKRIFEKWFCLHQWDSYSKKEYRWEDKNNKGVFYSETIEVLICRNCGKIKQIKY